MTNFNNSKFQNRPFEELGRLKTNYGNQNDRQAQRPRKYSVMPSLLRIGRDGENHVNIYAYGETDLGVMLSIDAVLPFVHEDFGSFNTIEGLRLWLHSVDNDNAFRTLDGVAARRYSKKIQQSRYVPNLAFHVLTATWNKIKQNTRLLEKIKNNILNYDCYYYTKPAGNKSGDANSLIRMRPSYAPWFIDGMKVISDAIKAEKEPDLSYFIDNKEEMNTLKNNINGMKEDSERARLRIREHYDNRVKAKQKAIAKNTKPIKTEEVELDINEQQVDSIKTNLSAYSDNKTIDDLSLIAGNRVLTTGQTTPATNGVYIVVDNSGSIIASSSNGITLVPNTHVYEDGSVDLGCENLSIDTKVGISEPGMIGVECNIDKSTWSGLVSVDQSSVLIQTEKNESALAAAEEFSKDIIPTEITTESTSSEEKS